MQVWAPAIWEARVELFDYIVKEPRIRQIANNGGTSDTERTGVEGQK